MLEQIIFKGLLFHEDYAREVLPHLESKFFTQNHRRLFEIYQGYFLETNRLPTLEVIAVELNELKRILPDELDTISNTLAYAIENESKYLDEEWLYKKTEEHCQAMLMKNAILQTIKLEEKDAEDKNAQILALFEEVNALSFDTSVGMDFFDDAASRYELYMAAETLMPFRLNGVNELFGGGGRRKTLACLVGRTNIGKSLHLCHYAADFLRQGLNVLYVSGEMSEVMTYQRIDSNLMDIEVSQFADQTLDKERYFKALNELKQAEQNGNIVVKEFPTAAANVGHIKRVIKELKQKRRFKPDVVIIDYLNLFVPQRKVDGGNDYSKIKCVAEELRGLMVEENVFGLTATQLNRSGSKNQEHADETDVSDSYGISMTMDIIIGIFDNEEMIKQNIQGLSLWKTRFSKKSNVKTAWLNVEWDYMRLREHSELDKTMEEAVEVIRPTRNAIPAMGNNTNNVTWG